MVCTSSTQPTKSFSSILSRPYISAVDPSNPSFFPALPASSPTTNYPQASGFAAPSTGSGYIKQNLNLTLCTENSKMTDSIGKGRREGKVQIAGVEIGFNWMKALTQVDCFLTYSPRSSAPKEGSYTYFLDCLGFKTNSKRRDQLIMQIRGHVDPSLYRFLRRSDNPKAFKTMVDEFLNLHGRRFWGPTDRRHLQQPDASKGFLYPRDTERPKSRY